MFFGGFLEDAYCIIFINMALNLRKCIFCEPVRPGTKLGR